jgi:glycosyltransferase involved in cell wall biosynthesis
MHICFLTNEYPKEGFPHGGFGSFVKTMSEALVRNNIQVTVLGLNYSAINETELLDGVTVIRLKKSTVKGLAWFFNSLAISKKIKEIHKKTPIHVVETSELGLAFLFKIKAIKYVIRLHGGHHFFAESENRGINWWKGFQEKRSFSRADAFIAVSNYVKEHTSTYLSYHDKKVEVIYNPINCNLFRPLDVKIEDNNITFAGTVCEKKGVRHLIRAFPLIKQKFPDAVLNLYGRDWFFSDGSSYINMLKKTELPLLIPFDKDVLFHGVISNTEIRTVYAKAKVCIFPSHMETLGLVATEAMAMQKAVVFSKLGPGKEIINHGTDGLLCDPYNPDDIAKKIIALFDDNDLITNLGINSRKTILEKFEIDLIVAKNINFYKKIF